MINKGNYEIAPLFADPVASSAPIKSGSSFKRPLGFDEALANVMTLSEGVELECYYYLVWQILSSFSTSVNS